MVSLGDYVLNGGEVAVLAIVEAVARLLPGVVGNADSLVEESHEDGLLEYPVYTRPASWDDAGRARGAAGPALRRPRPHRRLAARPAAGPHRRRRPDLSAPRGVAALGDLDVRLAPRRRAGAPRAAAGLLDARGPARGRLHIPPLVEDLAEVGRAGVDDMGGVCRPRRPGRLVGAVRGRVRPGDARVWEIGRLMVAPDLQGRGLGRALLAFAESAAPDVVATSG